jgi:hypothetical protein
MRIRRNKVTLLTVPAILQGQYHKKWEESLDHSLGRTIFIIRLSLKQKGLFAHIEYAKQRKKYLNKA